MDIFTQVLFVWLAWVLLVVEDSGSSIWTHGWKVISNLNLVVKPWHPVTNHVISPGSPRRLPWQKCGDHLSQKRIGNGALDYFMYDVVSLLPWPVRTWETGPSTDPSMLRQPKAGGHKGAVSGFLDPRPW